MRLLLAVTLLNLSMAACATGGITPRAREVRTLRGEVDVLEARSDQLETQLAEQAERHAASLEARESALRAEMLTLQGEVTALRAALEEQRQDEEAPVLAEAGGGHAVGGEPTRSRPSRRKAEETEEAVEEPEASPAERVHALMADVAARLQVAAEAVGDDQQSAARLGRARQLLVEADRAAAKKQYEQAETLAQDAAEVIADALTQVGTAQP